MTQKVKWTPQPHDYPADDIDALILSQEGEMNITQTVTAERASDDEPLPRTLQWATPDGLPPHMMISATPASGGTPATLTVFVFDWVGMFPIEIEYLKDRTQEQVTQWDAVPAPQSDVFAYRPDNRNVHRIRLVVTALDSSNAEIETATFTITVYANYNMGRDALQKAVRERQEAVA